MSSNAIVQLPPHTFPVDITLSSLYLALIYNRRSNNIEGCKFTEVEKSPTQFKFQAVHRIPLPLKLLVPKVKQLVVDEIIVKGNKSVSVTSISRSKKPLSICSTTQYKEQPDGAVAVTGTVEMKLWEKNLPKIMRSTFKKFSINKSKDVRTMEEQTARNFLS